MNPKHLICSVNAVAILSLVFAASARDIVVSPGGSLAQARDEAKAGDRIVLRGGAYRLDQKLVLGPEHSGVTWMAAPDETPVISGGRPVTGWIPHTNGIWKTRLQLTEKLRQLYVNDRPATMAEGPTLKPAGWHGEFVIRGDEPWAADGPGTAPDGLRFRKADLPSVSNPADLELQQDKVWTIQRVGIRGIDDLGAEWALRFDQPAAAIATKLLWGCALDQSASRLFNAYEFIRRPGDFYFNTADGWLYYKPRAGEDMNQVEAIIPHLQTLVRVKGNQLGLHADSIRFEGVTFAHTAFPMMPIRGCGSRGNLCYQSSSMTILYKNDGNWHGEPRGLYASQDVAPAAVLVTSGGRIAFHLNQFRLLGCLALNLENDVAGAEVSGNVFQWVEGAGVNLGHPQHSYIGKQNGDNNGWGPYGIDNSHDKWDERVEGLVKDIQVANNLFRNVCWNLIQMVPITLYAGHNVRIMHNDIQDTPYSGITCGWNWSECNGIPGPNKNSEHARTGGKPSLSMSGLLIARNRIVNPNRVLQDAANLYFVGDQARPSKNPIYQDEMAMVTGNYLAQEEARRRTSLLGCDEGTSFLRIEFNVLDGDRTGIRSVVGRGTENDRCKLFMNNWVAASEMDADLKFKDANCLVALNHFVPRPAGTLLEKEAWPPKAREIIDRAGLEPAYRHLMNRLISEP